MCYLCFNGSFCRQDNIIRNCTKLHDHSSNKNEISSAPRMPYFWTLRGRRTPLNIFQEKNYIFCTYGHIFIT